MTHTQTQTYSCIALVFSLIHSFNYTTFQNNKQENHVANSSKLERIKQHPLRIR